jgi:hypothetical protein
MNILFYKHTIVDEEARRLKQQYKRRLKRLQPFSFIALFWPGAERGTSPLEEAEGPHPLLQEAMRRSFGDGRT